VDGRSPTLRPPQRSGRNPCSGAQAFESARGSCMTFMRDFSKSPVIGIVRGLSLDEVGCLAQACHASGLGFVEITMNTDQACLKIERLRAALPEGVWVGAGTVLSRTDVDDALAAGARFVVSPVVVPEVMDAAAAHGVPVLPGALTPQEIWDAHRRGATLVKVFPVQAFGPPYLRELRGPFATIPLLACGGVRAENTAEYLEAGATGVAVGASTLRRSWLAGGNVEALAGALREVLRAAKIATPPVQWAG
jgi:2-dehydro-3-deoxyphosphogluconate aldolase / (4S)-4-hydroxy-2-oxoglutarate aldolase